MGVIKGDTRSLDYSASACKDLDRPSIVPNLVVLGLNRLNGLIGFRTPSPRPKN